jgi:hypothetical protein
VTFFTSDFSETVEYATQPKGLRMSAHFPVLDGSLTDEAPDFSFAPKGKAALAVWGLVLGSLFVGVITVAAVTATAWFQGAVVS